MPTPIFLNTPSTKTLLLEAANLIPEGTAVYLFGGAVRNALYYTYFNEEMTQRDFDCIVIGDGEKFAENLSGAGFIFGLKDSEKSKVLKKPRIPNPVHSYNDWLYLDCKIYPQGEDIQAILQKISDFTISGVAMNLKDLESDDWLEKIIAVPNGKEDIRAKKLRVIKPYAINLHKIIRMMSRGFEKPSESDVRLCFKKFKEISEEKFAVNAQKTIAYVGSEEKVLAIAKELGVGREVVEFR